MSGKSDVVQLIFENGWICSGTFLNPTTILTAAHCISGEGHTPLKKVISSEEREIDVREVSSIPHPDFKEQSWHSHDIGILKTTPNKTFQGDFQLETSAIGIHGPIKIYGCGKIDLEKNVRQRAEGNNNFFRIANILFIFGSSKNLKIPGEDASIAPNDSGGPIVDRYSGKIIAVAATSTAKKSSEYSLPALTTATSIVESSNLNFIRSHLDDREAK